MKHKISELEGALLDAAVASIEDLHGYANAYSTDWQFGGPLIERARISIGFDVDDYTTPEEPWYGECTGEQGYVWDRGPTALVAAMRAYVSSKFSEEIELP